MKAPCATQQTRESFVKAEGAQKKRIHQVQRRRSKDNTHRKSRKQQKSNDFFKANYYAPFLNHAAMLHRDGRAKSSHTHGEPVFRIS